MTEQEFRNALKNSVGNAGLSSDRQLQVLARMKGDEPKVRTWNKMKIAIVLAVVLVFSMGAAVATEIVNYVNWSGQPQSAPEHDLGDQAAILARMRELCVSSDTTVTAIVVRPGVHAIGDIVSAGDSTIWERGFSLEKLARLVQDDGLLDWPGMIPEEFDLSYGEVDYFCDSKGHYEVIEQHTTEDGYLVTQLTIPEEFRRVKRYQAMLLTEDSKRIDVRVDAYTGDGPRGVYISEDSSVTPLTVDGMEDALLISSPEKVMLTMRRSYEEPVRMNDVFVSCDGSLDEYQVELNGCTIEIVTQDCSLTAADLLAIFGLEAR